MCAENCTGGEYKTVLFKILEPAIGIMLAIRAVSDFFLNKIDDDFIVSIDHY